MTISEHGRTFEDVDKSKHMVTAVHHSHDGSKPSNKDENGADDRSGNYNPEDRYTYSMFGLSNTLSFWDPVTTMQESKVCPVLTLRLLFTV